MPRVLRAADLAAIIGWSTRRTRRWMQREGIARQSRSGGHVYTTPGILRERFPEVFEEVVAAVPDD